MFVPSQKKRQKKNIPPDAGHFLNTEINSADFKNEHLTTKIGRNKEQKNHIFWKEFSKTSSNRQNHEIKEIAKKISDKEITQIKELKTAGYVHTEDQDKTK